MNDNIKEQKYQNEARPNASEGAHDRLLGEVDGLPVGNNLKNDNKTNGVFAMFKKCEHPLRKLILDYIDYPDRCLHFKCRCGEKVYLGMDDE